MIHMRMADDHALDMALKIRLPDQPGRRPCVHDPGSDAGRDPGDRPPL